MLARVRVVTALMLLSFASVSLAQADPTLGRSVDSAHSPISVNSCSLMYNATQIAGQIQGVQIQFTNESRITADLIVFKVQINGAESLIRDVGTFTPGIEITHRYRAGSGQFALPSVLGQLFGRPSVTCRVDSAKFDDGSIWTPTASGNFAGNPNAAPSPISVLPQHLHISGLGEAFERIVLATEGPGAQLALNSSCGGVAKVNLLATTSRDLAISVTPVATGSCSISIRDAAGNLAMIPVNIR